MVREVRALTSPAALSSAAFEHIRDAAVRAVSDHGRFDLVLTGGRTPVDLYRRLSGPDGRTIPWQALHLWWGDERCVPPDHPESNYRLAAETILTGAEVPEENVHPIHCAGTPEAAAAVYEREVAVVRDREQGGGFDLVLLGMGEDGHVASLFPDSAALREQVRWVEGVVGPVDRPPRERVTLTLPALNAAREVVMLVAGAAKGPALARVLRRRGPGTTSLPASLIRPRERLLWLLDQEAAAGLGEEDLT